MEAALLRHRQDPVGSRSFLPWRGGEEEVQLVQVVAGKKL